MFGFKANLTVVLSHANFLLEDIKFTILKIVQSNYSCFIPSLILFADTFPFLSIKRCLQKTKQRPVL